MSAVVVGLAMFAAILHATWNVFLRTGADRLWTVTIMSFSSTIIAAPFLFYYPMPASSAWIYIVLSALLQVGYSVFLVAAYKYGELGQVYPIVRGTVPVLVTMGGVVLARDHVTTQQVIGVLLVAFGIGSLSLGKGRAATSSIFFALATGTIIASYGTVDALGVRESLTTGGYTAWVLVIYGMLLPTAFMAFRGRLRVSFTSRETWKALGGGLFAMVGYGVVVAAFALGPAGPITALRETSVVFAALIGWLFLAEPLTVKRIASCAIVAGGAICLGIS